MTIGEYNQAVDAFADNLYRFILKNLKDEAMAEDIIQDTFEKLWVRLEEVSYLKGLQSWIENKFSGYLSKKESTFIYFRLKETAALVNRKMIWYLF